MTRLRARVGARVQADESGAALMIALVFMSVFGVAIATVLGFAETSFRAGDTVQEQRYDVFAADGAIEAAIAAMRSDVSAGKEVGGSPCGENVDDLDGRNVVVECTPLTGSGSGGGGSGLGVAILTTSTSSNEPGIFRPSSDTLKVTGHVVSKSTIQGGANAKLDVTGDVKARSGCTPSDVATATGTLDCNAPAGDPAFTETVVHSDLDVPDSAPKTPPTCVPGTVLRLQAGTYNDATRLNALTGGLCAGALLWLEPGNFYFNFTNGGTHEWLVNDRNINIVAGTPNGFPTSGLKPLSLPFPGACSSSPAGTQLIFAGDSRLFVQAGEVELCAPTGGSEVAVYGTGDGTQQTGSASLKPLGHDTGTIFTTPAAAYTVGDSSSATVSLPTAGGVKTASLKLTGFDQANVPATATLTKATMQVVDAYTGDVRTGAITIDKVGGGTCTFQAGLSVNLMSASTCGITTAAPLDGAAVTFKVDLPNGNNKSGTASLDGIVINLEWLTAGLAPQSGCIRADGYNVSGGRNTGSTATHCAVVKTDGNFGNLAVQGALYVPKAPIDINLTNAATQLFTRGIVSRVAYISVTPASGFTGSVISTTGSFSPLQPREVTLVAKIPDPATGVLRDRLIAVVHFDDGVTGATPGQVVTVKRWDVIR